MQHGSWICIATSMDGKHKTVNNRTTTEKNKHRFGIFRILEKKSMFY
jgi:hypothetical protein